MLERDVHRMTKQQLITAYLELLRRYEEADAFRRRMVDRECAKEAVNQAIVTRSEPK